MEGAMHRCLPLLLALVVVGSFAGPMSCDATTRHVPAEYATINQALDASAPPGDSVRVTPGADDQYETRLVLRQFVISSVGFLRSGARAATRNVPSLALESEPRDRQGVMP